VSKNYELGARTVVSLHNTLPTLLPCTINRLNGVPSHKLTTAILPFTRMRRIFFYQILSHKYLIKIFVLIPSFCIIIILDAHCSQQD
jgi:hypothetical protein